MELLITHSLFLKRKFGLEGKEDIIFAPALNEKPAKKKLSRLQIKRNLLYICTRFDESGGLDEKTLKNFFEKSLAVSKTVVLLRSHSERGNGEKTENVL